MDLIARWRELEKLLHDKKLGWALHYAPEHLRWARTERSARGVELEHLLPDDYRAFVAAVGYPVIGFSGCDREGLSMLPPEAMAVQSGELCDGNGEEPARPKDRPTRARLAFFAGYELSDMEGFALAPPAGGGDPVVWLVEGAVPREELGSFSEWMSGEIARLHERIAGVDASTAAAWESENAGETDPHRLIDYSLDKKYDVRPYSAEDLALAWVEKQEGYPYAYGLIDAKGAWRIPLARAFMSVRPFRDGLAEVIRNDGKSSHAGPWVTINSDGTVIG